MMTEDYVTHTETTNGLKLKIVLDPDPENPREAFDHLAKMVCFHGKYDLGDKHDFKDPSDFDQWVANHKDEIALIKPMFMLDHSGRTVSTKPFGDIWDSGQIGYIYLEKEKIAKEFGEDLSQERMDQIIESEMAEYDYYIRGDVYGYSIVEVSEDDDGDEVEGEEVASSWGYYGSDAALEEAKVSLSSHLPKDN